MPGAAKIVILFALAGTVACSQNPTTPSVAGGAAVRDAGVSGVTSALLQKPSPQPVNLTAELVDNGPSDGAGPGTEIVGGPSPLTGTGSGSVTGGDYVASLSGNFSLTIRDLYSLPGVDTNYSCDAGQTNPPDDVVYVRSHFIGGSLSGNATVSVDQTARLSGTPVGKVTVELSNIAAFDGWTINVHSPSSGGALFSALSGGAVQVTPYFGGDPGTAPSGAVRFSKPATSKRANDGVSVLCRGDFILTLTP